MPGENTSKMLRIHFLRIMTKKVLLLLYLLMITKQNMYNRSISFKVLFRKPSQYIDDTRQTIFNYLNIMVPEVDKISLCHSVAIL